jgi:dipeptidyl aminopeptidase/acylaminoacyl peptidase
MNRLLLRAVLGCLAAGLLSAPAAQAAFPGSNGVVAFERKDGAEDFEIYNVSPGGGEGPLTTNTVDDRTPAYSPDGTKIAFVRGAGDGRDIWMMDANGSNQVQRTTAAGADLDPTWSPDGTRIAYSRQGAFSKDIYVVNADGSGSPTALTTDAPGDEINPAWSPDGGTLAFESQRDGNADIWVKTLANGIEANLTNTSAGVSNREPSWSPDGSRLTFMRDAGNSEIYTMDTCGGSQANLTSEAPNGSDTRPAFSPDGAQIVYASNRGGNVELWTVPAGGGGKTMITDTLAAESNAPDWQVDVPGGGAGSSTCGGAGGGGGGGGGGTGTTPDGTAPVITTASLSRSSFAAFRRGASIARNAPRGTRVSYRLSELAKAKLRIERAFKRGTRTRYRLLKGSFTHSGKAGLNRFRFTGRLRGRKLRPGRYRLVLVATDAAGNKSKARRMKFRIVTR